jgi:hypothetical protein
MKRWMPVSLLRIAAALPVPCRLGSNGTFSEAVANFAMRQAERRATDVEQTEKMVATAVDSVRSYFSQLFQPKSTPPASA